MSTTGGQTGSATGSSNSLSGMVSTLIPAAVVAIALTAAFFLARKQFRRVYAPRTFLDHLGKQRQTPAQSGGFFAWIKDFKNLKDEYILDHQSIDGYLFVRFFKVLITICFLGCLITWPVLFPVNATGGAGQQQLDMLSMSNVSAKGTNVNRYYAHALVSVVFLGMIMVIIARESFYTVNLRQAYRRSPWGASRLSAKTILFTDVPKDMTQNALFEMFKGVKHAWVASNTKELEKMVEDRDETALKLEAGEVQLSRDANTNRMKAEKGKKHFVNDNAADGTKWLNPKDRPTHKLKFLIGKKVDTIDYGRQHLAELTPKITQEQDRHWNGQGDLVGAVFLEFDTQQHAQDAWQLMQSRRTKLKTKLQARQLGVQPQEVIWNNLKIGKAQHGIRWLVATAIITLMIIFFAIPVAFVGLISNVNYLANTVTWLEWILKIPSVILGVITGLLPAVMLAILMALVPVFCRFLAKQAGYVTHSQVELKCQDWYFGFQVVQVFLITTLSSAITTVINTIVNDPSSILNVLAENLPKASNFYISYFILLGLAASSKNLLNIGGFVGVVLLGRILPGKTPRKIFDKLTKLSGPKWGSEFPKWINLGVIVITYSGIAPIVLGFATIGFIFLYIAFRYNFLYVYETEIDTKGEAYAKALRQLLVGVFLSELCLIGLFGIATAQSRYALGPLVIMAIMLAITVIFTISIKKAIQHEEARLAYTVPTPFNGHHEDGLAHEKPAPLTSDQAPRASRIPAFIRKFINPEQNSIHKLSASLDKFYHTPQEPLPVEIQKRAYFNPAVTSPTPVIWIVRDDMGISAREIRDTKKQVPGIEITDEQAVFNEKGKVYFHGVDDGQARAAPVFDERIIY